MEVSEVRQRLRHAIERSKQAAAARRAAVAAAERDYERFLNDIAIPVFRMMAASLTGEGIPFRAYTPAGTVRLASHGSGEDYVEVALDSSRFPPDVVLRTSRGRGRGGILNERSLAPEKAIAEITDEDLLKILLTEIEPFIAR